MPYIEVTFLLLHAPFIGLNLWIISDRWENPVAHYVLWMLLATYASTVGAFYLNLGDDFAIIHYWGMYFVGPGLFYWLKIKDSHQSESEKAWKTIGFTALNFGLGFLGLVAALTYDTPKWS